jgi:hypothetical protein
MEWCLSLRDVEIARRQPEASVQDALMQRRIPNG